MWWLVEFAEKLVKNSKNLQLLWWTLLMEIRSQIIAVSLSSQATPFTLHSFIHCSFKHTECCSFKTCRWYPAEKSPITEAEKTSADWIDQLWACDHVFAYSRAATISRWINHKKMNHWLFGNPIIVTSIWFLVCRMRRRRLVGLWETERFIN